MLGDVDDDLLPIGQFARLTRLSVKQLRHYDEIGLLRPACVDPATGYRYYRAAQARTAMSIGLLRSLDVPLPVVGQVLAGTEGALESVHDSLEAELARRRRTLASLERVMTDGLPATQVRIVTEPAHRVAIVRERATGPADIARATTAAMSRLTAGLLYGPAARSDTGTDPRDASGGVSGTDPAHSDAAPSTPSMAPSAMTSAAPSAGPSAMSGRRPATAGTSPAPPGGGAAAGGPRLIGLFPVDLADEFDVTAALVLADGWQAGGGAQVDVLPGGMFAAATHLGPYDQISLTAHAVLAWCAERRHPMRGPIREVYVSDPAHTPPDQLITHLMVPLEDEP
ncbi:MerR family transcriptional regulator [Nonomuraea aurantiaca]|uniref:MerR family transcriptional regulator n=1 Tax=Nonomuraea aurantiaca TaxID=2878562 RepID=UPI001CDA1DFA|nr:MerR family transcriptional regulator [Nonomuraea aurantiaca]MCA2223652.1 MerR family transcriptional regulator [Nonomuraea aurantiaca]